MAVPLSYRWWNLPVMGSRSAPIGTPSRCLFCRQFQCLPLHSGWGPDWVLKYSLEQPVYPHRHRWGPRREGCHETPTVLVALRSDLMPEPGLLLMGFDRQVSVHFPANIAV